MTEKDLENINQIDMTFKGYSEDEDDSFGAMVVKDEKGNIEEQVLENNVPVQTGIIVDFNDDEYSDFVKVKNSKQTVKKPFEDFKAPVEEEQVNINQDLTKWYNEIDLSYNGYGDDDDEDVSGFYSERNKTARKSMFDDEGEDYMFEKELVLEEDAAGMLKTNKVTVDTIEDDYIEELKRRNKEVTSAIKKVKDEEIEAIAESRTINEDFFPKSLTKIVDEFDVELEYLGRDKFLIIINDRKIKYKVFDAVTKLNPVEATFTRYGLKVIFDDKSITEAKQPSLKNLLRDLQRKHAKSIKKGAMGTHFHFAGNPEKGREMFNAGIGNQAGGEVFPGMGLDGPLAGNSGDGIAAGDGLGSAEGGGDAGGASFGGDGGGGGESLNTAKYNKLLREVFDTIGFDVSRQEDGGLLAKDLFNDESIFRADDIKDLIFSLQPFINITLVTPLSIAANQKFNDYNDWVNWYTDENKEKFPEYEKEIEYFDLLSNHLDKCEI